MAFTNYFDLLEQMGQKSSNAPPPSEKKTGDGPDCIPSVMGSQAFFYGYGFYGIVLKKTQPLPQHPLTNRSRYQGLYKHPLVGHVRIEAHPDAQWQLTMRCGSMGDAVLALDSEQSDTLFRVRFTGALAYLHEQIGGPIPPEARLVEFERGAATNSMQAVRLGFILLANWKPLAFHEQALFERVQ